MLSLSNSLPEKKQKLILTALNLMLSKGYFATTIDEICLEAGVTKGSYFHYFKNKEDIAKATLVYFTTLQHHVFSEAAYHHEKDPLTKLHKFLDHYLFIADHPELPNSCLASTFIQELSEQFAEIRVLCEKNFDANALLLEQILVECQKHYTPIQTFDAKDTAHYFTSLYQGSLLYARAKQNNHILKQNVEQFRQYITQMFLINSV